jgi:hypothetical protein
MPGKGRKFQAGNPGRPKGSPNKLTQIVRDLVTPAAPAILEDIVKRAKVGDPFAQRAFLTLLPPAPKFIEGPIELPRVKDAREALDALVAIAAGAAKGEVDLEGARFLADVLRTFINGYAAVELEDEVARAKLREGNGS